MWFTPDATASRRTAIAPGISRGGPKPSIAILSGELHGPVTEPVYSQRGAPERKARVFSHQKDSPTSSRSSSRAPRRCADRAHTPDAFTDCADNHIVRNDRADVAVLAVATADVLGRGNKAGHTDVAAPCGIVFHWNGASPSAASCRLI